MDGAEAKITKIRKRDGRIVDFDKKKIAEAIFKAAQSVGGKDRKTAEDLADRVEAILEYQFDGKAIPTVEETQDVVERVLMKAGHEKTAKAYILYRHQHKKIREMKAAVIDAQKIIDEYLNQNHWNVNENSNEAYSFSGLMLHTAGKVISAYTLNEIYPEYISSAHKDGHIHVHDLTHGFIGYCAGWSLKNLLIMGFGGVPNKVDAKPAKHMDVAISQMVNYMGCLQMEFAGAQAFSSVDTLLAPFVRRDNMDYEQVKQAMQKLVFSLNIPSRWGSQYPFTNLTFDWTVPKDMASEHAILGGTQLEATYADYQKEMDMINRAFLEVMLAGDANGRIFTFPIPTYNITRDFDWDSPNANLLFEVTAKYGTPYFQNYVGSNLDPSSIRAMCLHPDEELLIRTCKGIQKAKMGAFVKEYSAGFDSDGWSGLKEKIEALSLNPENFNLEWKPVKSMVKSMEKRMVKIRTRDGKTINITPNHPVSVLTPAGIIEKPAATLSRGEFLLSIKSARKCLSSDIRKIGSYEMNEDVAKFLGFFMADGNFLFENRKNMATFGMEKGIQLTFPGSCGYSGEMTILAERLFGVKAKLRTDPRYGTLYAYLYNAKTARELSAAGLNKYHNVPPQIWSSPASVIDSFLDGFFLGDGYEKRGEIHINDGELARELVLLYHLAGKPVTFRQREKSQVINIQSGKERKSSGLMGNPPLFERVPSWGVNTDKVPGLNHNRNVGVRTLQRYNAHTGLTKALMESDVYPIDITEIGIVELPEETEFYDIELEDNHRFVHSLGTVTHNCCRLNINQKDIMKRPGSMWGPGDSTGSIGVVTINMNRLGYEAENEEEFFEKLRYHMGIARDSLEMKRRIVQKNLDNGLMPYTKRYLGTWKNHFSTIGLCGMNECCLNFLGKDIATQEGKEFTIKVLNFMRDVIQEFQHETGNLYNLEATPAESTSYRFGRLDKIAYPDIITAGKDVPFLTNSTQMPVDHTDDVLVALEHQNDIQPLYTGGTIFHTFLGERVSSAEATKALVKKIAFNTQLPYFSITPTFSICKTHGYLKGEQKTCPTCGEETEIYSRIVGYFRPVKNWNAGKQEEFRFRKEYLESKALHETFDAVQKTSKPEAIPAVV